MLTPVQYKTTVNSEFTYHLVPSEKAKKWYCIQCDNRDPLFIGQYRVIAVPQEGPLEFLTPPISINCPQCKARIHIQTIC